MSPSFFFSKKNYNHELSVLGGNHPKLLHLPFIFFHQVNDLVPLKKIGNKNEANIFSISNYEGTTREESGVERIRIDHSTWLKILLKNEGSTAEDMDSGSARCPKYIVFLWQGCYYCKNPVRFSCTHL